MPQLQLPIFPAGVTEINSQIAVQTEAGRVFYLHGHLPVFQHEEQDVRSFRMFTSQMIEGGTVKLKLISGFCRLARWWVGVGRSLAAFRAEQILQGSDDGAAFFLGRRLNDTGEPCEGLRTTLILGTMGKLAHNHRRSQGPL